MSLADWINPINKVTEVVSEAVEDKDKRNAINAHLEELKQQIYLAELNTKTVPWVDALHKMGRQIMSLATLIAGVYLLKTNPDIDPLTLAAIISPAGIYNYIKGKGR